MTWIVAAQLLGGALLLLGNAFFSVTTEFALTRVRQFSEAAFQEPPAEPAGEGNDLHDKELPEDGLGAFSKRSSLRSLRT